jgi:GAF domain-containing protein
MHDAGIESVVIIPVYVDGLLTYQINIDFVYPQYFDEQVRRVYEAAQDQIVLVLNSQRLLDNTRRQASQLQQIANFSQSIQSTMDIGELLTNALVNAWQVVQMDHLAVMLSDPTTGQLELVAWHDDSAPYVVLGDERPVLMEATTAGHIWQTPAPFQVNDITRQTDSLHYAAAEDMRAVMTVPLYARGVVVGLIETGARETNVYTEIDFIIFQQLAGQLAVAIENAGAYQQSQRLARSKALVNDISSRLQQQTELDNILNLTVNELGRALGARRARIRLGTQSNGENGTEA